MSTTSDLFQPTTLDVEGRDLAETITSIEARGGIVVRLDVVSVSGYRLGIAWPNRGEGTLLPRTQARIGTTKNKGISY